MCSGVSKISARFAANYLFRGICNALLLIVKNTFLKYGPIPASFCIGADETKELWRPPLASTLNQSWFKIHADKFPRYFEGLT